jgi:hypothetical protein
VAFAGRTVVDHDGPGLYGGYIIPGSTLSDLHLSVSQWNTDARWPYRVMQHRIQGRPVVSTGVDRLEDAGGDLLA